MAESRCRLNKQINKKVTLHQASSKSRTQQELSKAVTRGVFLSLNNFKNLMKNYTDCQVMAAAMLAGIL